MLETFKISLVVGKCCILNLWIWNSGIHCARCVCRVADGRGYSCTEFINLWPVQLMKSALLFLDLVIEWLHFHHFNIPFNLPTSDYKSNHLLLVTFTPTTRELVPDKILRECAEKTLRYYLTCFQQLIVNISISKLARCLCTHLAWLTHFHQDTYFLLTVPS